MYQFVTTILAARKSKYKGRNLMAINVLSDLSREGGITIRMYWANIEPNGSIYRGPGSKMPLDEAYNIDEVLNNYDAFRKHILELVCIRMHESFEAWTII